MSISKIPNLTFVYCVTCAYRKKRKDLRRHPHIYYFCDLNQHELFGQLGCSDGSKLKEGRLVGNSRLQRRRPIGRTSRW